MANNFSVFHYHENIKEIQALYQIFIENYHKLTTIFSFNDPIEIYAMFHYLVYEGYLSLGKSFVFSQAQIDYPGTYGANIITGKGVCRNISAMLSDILNDLGILSYMLGVYCNSMGICINRIDTPKYTKDELVAWVLENVHDKDDVNFLLQIISEEIDKYHHNIEISTERVKESRFNKIMGNHAITFAIYDGKSYCLDATQFRVYRQKRSFVLYDKMKEIYIKQLLTLVFNTTKDYFKMCATLLRHLPSVSIDEEKKLIANTRQICKENTAIFDRFYNENSELYAEISTKLTRKKK